MSDEGAKVMNEGKARDWALRVLVEQEEGSYVAQCVDYDLVAFGSSPAQAIEEFKRAVLRHILVAFELAVPAFDTVPAPDPEYRERWERGAARPQAHIQTIEIPSFTIRSRRPSSPCLLPCEIRAMVA